MYCGVVFDFDFDVDIVDYYVGHYCKLDPGNFTICTKTKVWFVWFNMIIIGVISFLVVILYKCTYLQNV